VAVGDGAEVGVVAEVESDGAVPEGELAGEVDGGGCCCEGAGSLERCCHLILLLKRFFISARHAPLALS
jgi:hypothetical protein